MLWLWSLKLRRSYSWCLRQWRSTWRSWRMMTVTQKICPSAPWMMTMFMRYSKEWSHRHAIAGFLSSCLKKILCFISRIYFPYLAQPLFAFSSLILLVYHLKTFPLPSFFFAHFLNVYDDEATIIELSFLGLCCVIWALFDSTLVFTPFPPPRLPPNSVSMDTPTGNSNKP